MTKKLKEEALYLEAVSLLKNIGLTTGKFCIMSRAMDIAQMCEDGMLPTDITLDGLLNEWLDFSIDDTEGELRDAWEMLEDIEEPKQCETHYCVTDGDN